MTQIRLFILLFLAATVALTGCRKESFDPDEQFELEKPILVDFVTQHLPGATLHEPSGIWYLILDEGSPAEEPYEYKFVSSQHLEFPNFKAKYTGRLLNGTEFDSNAEGFEHNIGYMIGAWQLMFLPKSVDGVEIGGILPHGLKEGMRVRLVTPSYYGYGQYGAGIIPPNAPLDFTIELLELNSPSSNTPEQD